MTPASYRAAPFPQRRPHDSNLMPFSRLRLRLAAIPLACVSLATCTGRPTLVTPVFMTIDEIPDGVVLSKTDTAAQINEKLAGILSSYPNDRGTKVPLTNYSTTLIGDRSPPAPATVRNLDWFCWRVVDREGKVSLAPFLGISASSSNRQLLQLQVSGSLWHASPLYEWLIDPRNPTPPPGVIQDVYITSKQSLTVVVANAFELDTNGALKGVSLIGSTSESLGRTATSSLRNTILGKWSVAIPRDLVVQTQSVAKLVPGRAITLQPPGRIAMTAIVEEAVAGSVTLQVGGKQRFRARAGDWIILDDKTALELTDCNPTDVDSRLRVLSLDEAKLQDVPIVVKFGRAFGVAPYDRYADLRKIATDRYALIQRSMTDLATVLQSYRPNDVRLATDAAQLIDIWAKKALAAIDADNIVFYDECRKQVITIVAQLRNNLGITPAEVEAERRLALMERTSAIVFGPGGPTAEQVARMRRSRTVRLLDFELPPR